MQHRKLMDLWIEKTKEETEKTPDSDLLTQEIGHCKLLQSSKTKQIVDEATHKKLLELTLADKCRFWHEGIGK